MRVRHILNAEENIQPRRIFLFIISALLLVSLLMLTRLAGATTVTWTARRPCPPPAPGSARRSMTARFYVFGGLNNTTKLATVERYDPGTNTWDSRAAMPTARYATSAVTLNGKIYVIGGVNASNQIQKIVEVYDPVSDTWSTAASMPTARCRLAAVAGPDGKIYAIGGSTTSTLDMTGYTSVVEVYNPATNTWATAAPMNTPRVGLAAAVSGGKIYVFGGYGKPPGYTARYLLTVEVYDPASNTWSRSASMNDARYGLAATSTSNGLIYLIGGKNESSVPPSNNEEYIPSSGASSYIAGLPSGQRSELAAVSIHRECAVCVGRGQPMDPDEQPGCRHAERPAGDHPHPYPQVIARPRPSPIWLPAPAAPAAASCFRGRPLVETAPPAPPPATWCVTPPSRSPTRPPGMRPPRSLRASLIRCRRARARA